MNTAPESLDTVSIPANLSRSWRPAWRGLVVSLAEHADAQHRQILELGPGGRTVLHAERHQWRLQRTGTKVLAARPTRDALNLGRDGHPLRTGTWPKASRSEDGVSLFVAFTRVHSPLEPKTDSPSRPYLRSIRARQPHPGVHAPCFSRHCGHRSRRSDPTGLRLATSGYRRAPRVRRQRQHGICASSRGLKKKGTEIRSVAGPVKFTGARLPAGSRPSRPRAAHRC